MRPLEHERVTHLVAHVKCAAKRLLDFAIALCCVLPAVEEDGTHNFVYVGNWGIRRVKPRTLHGS